MTIGFLFDNDGVLIDSSTWHWRAWQKLQEEEPLCTMTYEEFVKHFGKRNDLILKEVFPDISLEKRKAWETRKEELFRQIAKGNITLLPGMETFLEKLQEHQVPKIIASSTPIKNLQMFLESTVLGKYFSAFVSAEEVPHGKPFPDVFLEGAKRLKLKPAECIVIEDAPAGIEAGKRAGCFVVALETTHAADQLTDYDLIVPSPKELDLDTLFSAYRIWKTANDKALSKTWRLILGIFLLLLGIVSLFIPFSPGIFIIGLGLFFINEKWFKQRMTSLKQWWKSKRSS